MIRNFPVLVVFFAASTTLAAGPSQKDPANCPLHAGHVTETETIPESSGQSAFGAIAEIVQILEEDPATDWSRVDIDALREHLIDMEELVLHACGCRALDPRWPRAHRHRHRSDRRRHKTDGSCPRRDVASRPNLEDDDRPPRGRRRAHGHVSGEVRRGEAPRPRPLRFHGARSSPRVASSRDCTRGGSVRSLGPSA